MFVKRLTLNDPEFPEKLRHIATPPKQLYTLGYAVNELLTRPCVTVVGSRKVSAYGNTVTKQLVGELAKAGIVIISGLAIGVDSIAHAAALEAGGLTIAVLPSGVEKVYPSSHAWLAKQILQQGGALISEQQTGHPSYKSLFIARNRIAAGLSDAVLITEAAERSGTLHTANFALEQGRPVLAVPGNITSPLSAGTNNLIKTGATPVTGVDDIFHALGLQRAAVKKEAPKSSNPNEQVLLDLLYSGISDGGELLEGSRLEVSLFNQTLTMLEICGRIRALGNNRWALQ
jgi:DNA processing protein